MSAKRNGRFAGPCTWCESCIDYEDGVCLLLSKICYANEARSRAKCVAWQPRKGDENGKSV